MIVIKQDYGIPARTCTAQPTVYPGEVITYFWTATELAIISCLSDIIVRDPTSPDVKLWAERLESGIGKPGKE